MIACFYITGRLKQRYLRIRDNWRRLTNCEFRQETFWATYVRISIFIPILATLPMYLAKTMTFGDMMQTRTSFARVQDSFGWFTDSYRRLIEWAAVVERLSGFQTALSIKQGCCVKVSDKAYMALLEVVSVDKSVVLHFLFRKILADDQ